jgi:hypothetical protein
MLGGSNSYLWTLCQDRKTHEDHMMQTLRPTSSEPMNVMCLIIGDWISAFASSGQQQVSCDARE